METCNGCKLEIPIEAYDTKRSMCMNCAAVEAALSRKEEHRHYNIERMCECAHILEEGCGLSIDEIKEQLEVNYLKGKLEGKYDKTDNHVSVGFHSGLTMGGNITVRDTFDALVTNPHAGNSTISFNPKTGYIETT